MVISGDILRGHTETFILNILSKGDSYGYEMTKNIHAESEGLIDIKDATIYTALSRMEKEEAAQEGDIIPLRPTAENGIRN